MSGRCSRPRPVSVGTGRLQFRVKAHLLPAGCGIIQGIVKARVLLQRCAPRIHRHELTGLSLRLDASQVSHWKMHLLFNYTHICYKFLSIFSIFFSQEQIVVAGVFDSEQNDDDGFQITWRAVSSLPSTWSVLLLLF